MNGTRASSIGAIYSAAPAWSLAGGQGALAAVPPEFIAAVPVEPAEPVAGRRKKAAAFFTTTNMLIGGGVLLAGGGIAAAASGGGGGSSGAAAPAPPYATSFTNFSTTESSMILYIGPGGLGDTPADRITVTFNGVTLLTDHALPGDGSGDYVSVPPLSLNMGANTLVVQATGGGSNGYADISVAFVNGLGGDISPPQDVSIAVGSSSTCTITRTSP